MTINTNRSDAVLMLLSKLALIAVGTSPSKIRTVAKYRGRVILHMATECQRSRPCGSHGIRWLIVTFSLGV